MIEVTGDLFTYQAQVRVITTNGDVNKRGLAVMGRGCALEAAQRWAPARRRLAQLIERHGNHVRNLRWDRYVDECWFTFPVKHHWHEKADLDLIARSAKELAAELPMYVDDDAVVVIPRPGCGNGQLRWADVKPVLEPIFTSDRYHIITFGGAHD